MTMDTDELDGQIEELVHAWNSDDLEADALLKTLAYHKIYQLVRRDRNKRNASLFMDSFRTSDFVHDVWCRVATAECTITIETKKQFYSYIQSAMHSYYVDQAKKANAKKRKSQVLYLDPRENERQQSVCSERIDEEITVVTAIDRLIKSNEEHANLLMYKYYSGLTAKEISNLTGKPIRYIESELRKAKETMKLLLDSKVA